MYLIFVTSLTWYIFTRFGGVILNQERREEGDGGGAEVRVAILEGSSIIRGPNFFCCRLIVCTTSYVSFRRQAKIYLLHRAKKKTKKEVRKLLLQKGDEEERLDPKNEPLLIEYFPFTLAMQRYIFVFFENTPQKISFPEG
jgi:hypothetical protein